MLDGDGTRAGLKQIISERNQADLGANGLGRLTLSSPILGTVALTEDITTFGMKMASVSSNLSNAIIAGPAGAPPELSVDFTGGSPNPGEAITVRFTMPDGTSQNMTLTATTANPPPDGSFTIGVNGSDSAARFQSAMDISVGKLAATSLTAASAVQASNEFFDADVNNPPLRVDGPPFDSATGLVAGTTTNSVIWYTGELGVDSARSSATARIDPSLSVSYGMRANEDGIRSLLQGLATMAAVTVPDDANATELSTAFYERVANSLTDNNGGQTISTIQTDLANAQVALDSASKRHAEQSATLSTFLDQIEGVSNEEVGVQILTLQTRLQASMQVTSMLYQTSLVNYIN
jgi:hypothetical protein